MNLYNLVEYSDNYEQTSGSLWQCKRDEQPLTAVGNTQNLTTDNSSSFKYKSNLLKGLTTEDDGAGVNVYKLFKNAQIIVLLKYLSSFFRSAEILFINTKLHIELNWTKNSVLSNVDGDNSTTFKITKTEMHVPVVTLNTYNSLKLTKLLSN